MREGQWILGVSLLALLGLLLSGCGRIQNEWFADEADEPEGVTMQLSLPGEQEIGVPGDLIVTLEKYGVPVEGAAINIEGNMTHAGMQPIFVRAIEVDPGEYRAELDWTMGGQWFVTAEAELPDGSRVSQTLDNVQVSSP